MLQLSRFLRTCAPYGRDVGAGRVHKNFNFHLIQRTKWCEAANTLPMQAASTDLRCAPCFMSSSSAHVIDLVSHRLRCEARTFWRCEVNARSGHEVAQQGATKERHDLSPTEAYCLEKLVNLCMVDGKKNKSYKIISNALCRLSANQGTKWQTRSGAITYLMKAIDNVKPLIEVRKIRISGSTQLVPCIISQKRQQSLAIRWILEAANKRRNARKHLSLDECLVAEFVDAFHKTGTVRKKRDDLHKLAESNRGFAHYRWW